MKKLWNFILKLLGLYKPNPESAKEIERKIQVLEREIEEIEDGSPEDNVAYLNSDDKLH